MTGSWAAAIFRGHYPMRHAADSLIVSVLLATSLVSGAARAADDYPLGPESQPQEGVPRGTVTQFAWTNSTVFPGTTHDYWVYVPAQYRPEKPACVMVVQDGKGRADEWRVPTVLDNLIHKGEVPVTIGVFISPGVVPALSTNALPRFNRSFEYDGLGDDYARFLLDELLPALGRTWNLSTNGNDRLIAGASSGAICAFTAAWERPDAFRRVYSTIGTYVGLRGGNDYPTLIRKTEPKPIRVYLQDGSNDLNIYGGNWYLANLEMLSALEFAGYEVNHAWGDGGHTGKHGAAVLPEALRWLWKDYPAAPKAGVGSKQPLMDILIPGEEWQLVSSGHKFTEGPAANPKGEVFFTDIPNNRIHKIDLDGRVTVFAENSGAANGLMFGPDGYLYACQNGRRRIARYDEQGAEQAIVEDAPSNDLVVLPAGGYYTDPENHRVWYVDGQGQRTEVDKGLGFPNGLVTSPDQSLLYVADTRSPFVFSYQIQPGGTLAHRQRFFELHLPPNGTESGADGMKVDTLGRLYVATALGVQVCDQAGRVNGIIAKPQRAWLANLAFGGAQRDELYVTCGDKVFKRKTKARGVLSYEAPIRPPAPRL